MADRITEALEFMEACGVTAESHAAACARWTFFTSHEALLLGFEQAMTRVDSRPRATGTTPRRTCCGSATAPASSTARMSSSCRGIANPIGVKCGPTHGSRRPAAPDRRRSTPTNEPGRLTLIGRFGADKVESRLPRLLRAIQRDGPQRGLGHATRCTATRVNVRERLQDPAVRPHPLRGEELLRRAQAEGTHAGGVHLEMTGQDVTECTGGAQAITEGDLADRYHTHCDPRLNASRAWSWPS